MKFRLIGKNGKCFREYTKYIPSFSVTLTEEYIKEKFPGHRFWTDPYNTHTVEVYWD